MGSNDPADREDIALSTSELDDVLSSAEIRSESGTDEDSGLEKYGIWIKVEPETLERGSVLDAGPAAGSRLTAEEEQLLGELEADAEAPTLAAEALRPSGEAADFEGLEKDLQELDTGEGQEEVADLDLDLDLEEMSAEPGKESEIEVPLSDSIPELDSLEQAAEPELRGAGPVSSDAILKKIEQDLKQIKAEIQNLKKELAGRGTETAGAHAGAAPGFFTEEEDDSIALTGDELDNILNTAEITEEQAAADSLEDLQAASPPEAVEELPELDDLGLQEPALPEAAEAMEAPGLDTAEDLELLEPGSLSAEPEQVQIELEEKPAAVDLDLGGMADELPEAGEPELEELQENGASELVLEEPSEAPLPKAEELGLEELSLEPAAELQMLQGAGEAEPADAESLELVEELPDLSLTDERGAATEASAEPIELELGEEGAAEPIELEHGEEGAAEPIELELGEEGAAETLTELPGPSPAARTSEQLPEDLREDVKSVLSYLDQLLEALPEDKIKQFAQSEYFGVYKRLFEELGLGA
jgi:hypothetical protein